MEYMVEAALVCDKGRLRQNNEDNFYFGGTVLGDGNDGLEEALSLSVNADEKPVFAVFDGVGGEALGEQASAIAADELGKCVFDSADNDNILRFAALRMNERVLKAAEDNGVALMATTMAALRFAPGRVTVCNVGDSRVYKLDGKKLVRLSLDHTAPIAEGELKPRLSQYVGQKKALVPFVSMHPPENGDVYLVCSDGVTDMISEEKIAKILSSCPVRAVQKLRGRALENGGLDNITAIVCKITEI